MRSPWRAGCDLSKQETVKGDKVSKKKWWRHSLWSGCFQDFYLSVWSLSRCSGWGASFLLWTRSARPCSSMSAFFRHHLLITIQPCLLFLIVTIILTAALQLLLGWNKLVLILSIWVQVQLVVQKIPDPTVSEVSLLSAETMSSTVSGLENQPVDPLSALTAAFWCETTPAELTSSWSSSVWWWPAASESFHYPLQPCQHHTSKVSNPSHFYVIDQFFRVRWKKENIKILFWVRCRLFRSNGWTTLENQTCTGRWIKSPVNLIKCFFCMWWYN